MNKSYRQEVQLPRFPKLALGVKKASFDVVVIGGGITGLVSAYLLKQAPVTAPDSRRPAMSSRVQRKRP